MLDEVSETMAHKEFNMPHILSVRGLILVVEDRLTEIYLRELFSDIPMSFVVAGGCQAVKALVNDLRRRDNSEVQRVFGIVDCDFAKSNFQRWRDAEKGTVDMFRLVRNETENYLLDGKVMCKAARRLAAPKPLDEDLIDNVILREASGQKFWIACRSVVSALHERLCSDFPRHPRLQQIQSLDSAVGYIWNEPWFKTIRTRADDAIDEIKLTQSISAAVDEYGESIKDGSWVETCSGKEVYDTICQTMFQDVAHKRDDFAKAIAESQRADSMLPKDMIELHDVLFGVHAKLISVNG